MAPSISVILTCLAFHLAPIVSAHSWIDYIIDDTNTNNVGYPRGYVGHNADLSITQYKVLDRDPSLPVCGPSQRTATYSSEYPMLTVAAGSPLSAIYLENGHVTKDRLPPDNSPHPGNYSWYLSSVSGSLVTFGDLTDANKLSGPSPFDDGKCAVDAAGIQGRPGPIDCVSHFTLPSTLAAGRYQLVWWWDFQKLTLQDPSYTEYYTSCFDVEVLAGTGTSASVAADGYAQAALPVMSALYSNTTFIRPELRAAPTPVQEQDVLVISHANTVVTTTFQYDHPTADLPKTTSTPAPFSAGPAPTLTTPAVSGAVVAAAAATMLVNSLDGSLYAMNAVVGANNVVQEVAATTPVVVAGPSATAAAASECSVSPVTVYQPVYITVTADCPAPQTVTVTVDHAPSSAPSAAAAVAVAAVADDHLTTTITSTTTVTRSPSLAATLVSDATSFTTTTLTTTAMTNTTVTVTTAAAAASAGSTAGSLARRRVGHGHAGNVQRYRARH